MSISVISQNEQSPKKSDKWIIWGAVGSIGLFFIGITTFLLFNTKWPIVLSILLGIIYFLIICLPEFVSRKSNQSVTAKHCRKNALQEDSPAIIDITYLCSLIVLGISFTFLFAPGTVPDESYHFNCSYKFSDVLLGQSVSDESFPVREEDKAFIERLPSSPTMTRNSYDQELSELSLFVGSDTLATHTSASPYSFSANLPQVKWPTVLALFIGRLLHLGTIPLFFLGRLANLSYYIALCWLAVKFTPIGKNIFRVISLLPMSLHLAGSYSYDAGGMGLMFLLTALLLKALLEKGQMSRSLLFSLPALTFLTMPVKVVYLPAVLLVFFIPADRFPSKQFSLLYKCGFVLASILGILAVRLDMLLNLSGIDAESTNALAVRGTETGTMYSIGYLISHPLDSIKLFISTFYRVGDFYIKTTWGGSLGWFQDTLVMPQFFGYLYVVLLGLSCLRTPADSTVFSPLFRIILLVIFIFILGINLLAMATSWTFIGEMTIQGVQGRYFIPALPFALLSCRTRNIGISTPNASRGIIAATLCIDIWYVVLIFGLILSL